VRGDLPLITKARGKPQWQRGLEPPSRALRDSLAITAAHEAKFAEAYADLLRKLLTPEMRRTISAAVRSGSSVKSIMRKIPFFDPKRPETFATWEQFAIDMEHVYTEVINATIENENEKRGWSPKKVETLKADEPTIPVNVGAAEFVRRRSLTRVVDMSEKEAERVQAILEDGLKAGATPGAMVAEIEASVGLTAKQHAQLGRRLDRARELGMNEANVKRMRDVETSKIRRTRAKAIARTETNDAMARGLTDSWVQAAEAGLIPKGVKREWAAMGDESTSDICEDLDGQQVGLDENFSTTVGEGFNGPGPPAHPNCRSTLILVFPE